MDVFIVMYILFALLFMFTKANNRAKSNNESLKIFIICFIYMWMLLAFRSPTVGNDIKNILPQFENATFGSDALFSYDEGGREWGWQVLLRLIAFFTNNFQIVIVVTSTITLLPVLYVLKKQSSDVLLSIVIYASFIIYHFSFSGIRQSIALALTTVSYLFIIKNKPVQFIALVFLAYLFHKSALVFLIAYPLSKVKFKPVVVFGLAIAVVLSISAFGGVIQSITAFIFPDDSYMDYFTEKAGAYHLAIIYLLFIVFTFIKKGDSENDPLFFYRWMISICFLLQILGMVSYNVTRITYYFIPYICLAFPSAIANIKGKSYVGVAIAILMCAFFFYNNAGGYLNVIPYSFFWN